MQNFTKRPNNYKGEDSRHFKAYRELSAEDLTHWGSGELDSARKYTHLKIEVSYYEGGMNYFSGGVNKRGYRLNVTPVCRNEGSESYSIMGDRRSCGGFVMLEEAKRYNSRRLAELAQRYDDKVEEIARAVIMDDVHALIAICRIEHEVATV